MKPNLTIWIAYFFRASTDKAYRYDYSLLFTQNGSEPEPRYILRHPDPASPVARNCYACALFDAFIPDILFGEVLLKPEWSQPTLSAQEIRQNTGVNPPPLAVIPPTFTVQLYNPPQQVVVTEKRSSWGPDSYSFTMPQWTFRAPSTSALDRQTNDPTADVTTPQLKFVWRKEGRVSTSLICYLTGKTTDTNQKKKGGKEPDIAIALLNNYRDLTIYESNFHRVDMEDYKGLEVVMLLSAAAIRDVYCGQRKDAFNNGEAARKNSGGVGLLGRKKSSPALNPGANGSTIGPPAPIMANRPVPSAPPGATHGRYHHAPPPGPPADPHQQWEIDAETTRLKRAQENERRATEARRREREHLEELETQRIKKMIEAEEKSRRKKQAEIDKETARLRKKYGDQSSMLPSLPLRPGSAPHPAAQSALHLSPYHHPAAPIGAQSSMHLNVPHQSPGFGRPAAPPKQSNSPYGNIGASMSSFFHAQPNQAKPKKSFLGLRRLSDAPAPQTTLHKKKSSMF